jgi:hypothetical protein
MKYKVGDKVRIRSKEWIDAQEKDEDGDIGWFVQHMFPFAGRVATVIEIRDGGYRLNVDGADGHYTWEDQMFDPDYVPANEPLSAEDAARAMLDGDTLYDRDGREHRFNGDDFQWSTPSGCGRTVNCRDGLNGLFRRPVAPVKRKRLMTRWEVLDWANSEASRGWMVYRSRDMKPTSTSWWQVPQYYGYGTDFEYCWRARLLPDLSGIDESTIQQFTVEE